MFHIPVDPALWKTGSDSSEGFAGISLSYHYCWYALFDHAVFELSLQRQKQTQAMVSQTRREGH
jgi:hypothetical protein